MRKFNKKFEKKLGLYIIGEITKEMLIESLQGWFGYAQWADTFKLRQDVFELILKV